MLVSVSSAGVMWPVPADDEQGAFRSSKSELVPGTPSAALVALESVSKKFGRMTAVHPLSLEIHRGDFLAILGPSGCGKTTLLRMIGGFIEPSSGTIRMEGIDVTRLGPDKRPTNMVFQGYGLFPHMSVRQNIAYGLRIARHSEAEIAAHVAEAVSLVHLDGLENRSVTQLSGGQAQRVALARALVMRPAVLLLDEPLAALDLKLRKTVQEELRRIHRSIGGTFVFVTHDQDEAMALSNRVVVMEAGRIVQEGTAEEIYEAPQNRFVSTFIGEANLFPAMCRAGVAETELLGSFHADLPDGPAVIVVRPQAMQVWPVLARPAEPAGQAVAVCGRLADSVFMGAMVKYDVVLPSGSHVTVLSPDRSQRHHLAIGDEVVVSWPASGQRIVLDA
jgi:ABC-type Fe3+/spermidine/putrescine transport system ATPase subunit